MAERRNLWLAVGAIGVAALLLCARVWPLTRDASWIVLCSVAVLTFVILLAEAAGVIRSFRMRRVWDITLVVLAATTVWTWLALFGLDVDRLLHVWDSFHYYVGGKYFEELRYERLYECTLIVDSEAPNRRRFGRDLIRDLGSNELLEAAEVLARPDRCKSHFTPERWKEFGKDVAFFRARLPGPRWRQLKTDHGYNPPPPWLLLGGTLAGLAPASRTQLAFLSLLDPIFLAGMFGFVAYAFGWRVMLLALIYFGTNWQASFSWVGGGILRYGWLVAAIVGICLLRRNRMAFAGALLAWSASLRVFPLSIPAFVGLGVAFGWLRERRISLSTPHWRLLGGAVGGALLIVVVSTPLAGGPEAWGEFVANSRLHLNTPLNNHMGLPAVFAYDHDQRETLTLQRSSPDPYEAWRQHRRETFDSHAVPFWLLTAALGTLLIAAVRGKQDWIAAIVGTAAIPVFFEVTCYYHAVLVALVLLWPRWKLAGVAMLGLSCVSLALAPLPLGRDQYFFWMNVATLSVVVLIMGGLVLVQPAAEERAPS